MSTTELNPIIFIPGLMGSIGGEILGTQVEWSFGVAGWFYRPFINELEKMGYEVNGNLWICYYDWRKGCEEIVDQFLMPILTEVKKKYPTQKVDLLCHSMGGVVGRTYIQGEGYLGNVQNFMCFGTPNRGNIEAYYLWSTGKIMKDKREKNLMDIIRSGYIWILTKILEIPLGADHIEELHHNFRGLGDLIPSQDYGDILCYKEDGETRFIPRKYTVYENPLLDRLNKEIISLKNGTENIYCFVGDGHSTWSALVLDKEVLLKDRKGCIKSTLRTKKGDGTVTVHSAKLEDAKLYVIEGSHTGILLKSIEYLEKIYNLNRSKEKKASEIIEECPFGIILQRDMKVELKNEEAIIGKFENGRFTTEHDYIAQQFGKNYIWIMMRNLPKGKYSLVVEHPYGDGSHIFVCSPFMEKELSIHGGNVQCMNKFSFENL